MTVTIAGAPVIAFVLASVRLVAWLAIVPPFSSRAVPAVAKVLLALGLAFAVAPQIAGRPVPEDAPTLFMTALQEALIGATLGFVTYLVFAAIQAAGDLIDVFGGFSLAAAFDPLSQNMNSVNGKLFSMLATMLLFATNAHLLVLGGLLRTFGDDADRHRVAAVGRHRRAHPHLLDVLHRRGADRAAADRGAVPGRPRARAADPCRARS